MGGEGGWAGFSSRLGQIPPTFGGRGGAQGCLLLPPGAVDPPACPSTSQEAGLGPGVCCCLSKRVLPKSLVLSDLLESPASPISSQPSPALPCPHLATSPQFCLELYNPSCRGQKIKACKTDGDGKVVEGKH